MIRLSSRQVGRVWPSHENQEITFPSYTKNATNNNIKPKHQFYKTERIGLKKNPTYKNLKNGFLWLCRKRSLVLDKRPFPATEMKRS